MANIDYIKLYNLQDDIMDIIFNIQDIFYLTGGTCLCRFHKEKRYSDDLDFFTNENKQFSKVIRIIKIALNEKFEVNEEIISRDFVRLIINNFLQIDFVNDRVMRYKDVIYMENGYCIDNYENILANKLTAIMSRDNPKDIFDIYLINKYYTFNWAEIVNIAHQKADFKNDDLIIRLKSFPIKLLNQINLIDVHFLDNFEIEYYNIIDEMELIID
jgi:predicted nucleotidyltransferase component of viral defense system